MALGLAQATLDQFAPLTLGQFAAMPLDSTTAENFRVVTSQLFAAGAHNAELFQAGAKKDELSG